MSTRPSRWLREAQAEYIAPDRVAELRDKLAAWGEENLRSFPWREPGVSEFQLVVTEILLQQTQAASVAARWALIFNRLSSWADLRRIGQPELVDLLQPLGLSKRRASALKKLAAAIEHVGDSLPDTREALEALPAVGQYVASALLSHRVENSEPLLDVNLARVLSRVFGRRDRADLRDDAFLQVTARQLVQGANEANMNYVLLDFAALVCRARAPDCRTCPAQRQCVFRSGLSPSLQC